MHNYLVDCRYANTQCLDLCIDNIIFHEEITGTAVVTTVVGNDLSESQRGLPNSNKECGLGGLRLGNNFRLVIMNHDMHCPRNEKWMEDDNLHMNRL